MNGVKRLWVVSHEPKGLLVSYLDAFAMSLDEQGFKRHLISRQIRVTATLHALQTAGLVVDQPGVSAGADTDVVCASLDDGSHV